MNFVDRLVLKQRKRVVITSFCKSAGNPFNAVEVRFTICQPDSLLQEEPWNSLIMWSMSQKFWGNNCCFSIDRIPETISANEVAEGLAAHLVTQDFSVLLKKWVSPSCYQEQVLE